jgi:hypothetical protein
MFLRQACVNFLFKCATDSGLVLIGTRGLAKSTSKCELIYLFAKPGNAPRVRQLLQVLQLRRCDDRQVYYCADALV